MDNLCSKDFTNLWEAKGKLIGRNLQVRTEKQNKTHRTQSSWEECEIVAKVLCRWGWEEDTCSGLRGRNGHHADKRSDCWAFCLFCIYQPSRPSKCVHFGPLCVWKEKRSFALLLHYKSVLGQFRASDTWSVSWTLSPVFVIARCDGCVSEVILSCSVQRNAAKMRNQGNEAREVCVCNMRLDKASEK